MQTLLRTAQLLLVAPIVVLAQQAGPPPGFTPVNTKLLSGRDNAQLNNAIDAFASLALLLNAPVTVMNYPEGMHGFEVEDFRPEVKTPANVAATGRILQMTLEWISRIVY